MKKILLAEDDVDVATVLKQYLELHDYNVGWAGDGEQALALFQKESFCGCIIDVMMPKMDGFTLAEKIISINPGIPFIFLTARTMKEDKVRGLKLGADDYISKPFEPDELLLRLDNILKRSQKHFAGLSELQIGRYSFFAARMELTLDNELQRLTEKETALILFLYQNRNKVLKREAILRAIWGNEDYFSGRSMDVFISRLRKYFKCDPNIALVSTRNYGLEFRLQE
ncbi:MAG TPA: response regulator transcription factor [Flavobacterium sp.]|jgi:DNA-binding response OmpR family regulator